MLGWRILLFGCALIFCNSFADQGIDVYDGFESPELSSVWSEWRFLPGAVEMQPNVVRQGKSACKITLRPGDQMDDEIGAILERAELAELPALVSLEDSCYSYSFSLFPPQDFPIVPTRLILAQWKQYSKSENFRVDNPVIALRYQSGKLRLTCQIGEDKTVLYELKEDIRNKWLDFKFRLRFSTGENGLIKAWLNGNVIADYAGTTAYAEEYGYTKPNYFYFKIGLYRDHLDQPMTIYIDEYFKRQLPDAGQK